MQILIPQRNEMLEQASQTRGPRECPMRPANIKKYSHFKRNIKPFVQFSQFGLKIQFYFSFFSMRPVRPYWPSSQFEFETPVLEGHYCFMTERKRFLFEKQVLTLFYFSSNRKVTPQFSSRHSCAPCRSSWTEFTKESTRRSKKAVNSSTFISTYRLSSLKFYSAH